MDLPIKNKLILIFISQDNPLMVEVAESGGHLPRRLKGWFDFVGVAQGNPPNWKKGRPVGDESAEAIFANSQAKLAACELAKERKAELKQRLSDFRALYFKEEPNSLHKGGALLGMSEDACQKIIDLVTYDRAPLLFSGLVYDRNVRGDAQEVAAKEAAANAGIYNVWLRRTGTKHWLRCPMRVRYVLEVGGSFVIRCKLAAPSVPNSRGGQALWEYDGFLAVRDYVRLYWMFQQRDGQNRGDFLYIITDVLERVSIGGEERWVTHGSYLTTDQLLPPNILANDVVIERLPDLAMGEMEQLLVSGAASVRDEAQCDRVAELLGLSQRARLNSSK